MLIQIITNPYQVLKEYQEKIFKYYLKLNIESKLITSPFREDKNPTCGFYYSKNGTLYLHDFATEEHHNAYNILEKYEKVRSKKSLQIVLAVMVEKYDNVTVSIKKSMRTSLIDYTTTRKKHPYFKDYHISDEVINKYVTFVKEVFVNEISWKVSTEEDPIFAYKFKSGAVKFYSPLTKDKTKKWIGTDGTGDMLGDIPEEGDLLIITSSSKDVMVLETLGYHAVNFSSEGFGASKDSKSQSREFLTALMLRRFSKYKEVIFFMDGDDAGIKYNKLLSKIYKKPYMHITVEENVKDISDYCKKHGLEKTKELIQHLITNKKPEEDEIPF